MNINDLETKIWDENILFYRILKCLIQQKLKHVKLFELQILIERNKNIISNNNSWINILTPFFNNNIIELLLVNNKNNQFIDFLDFAISLIQLKDLLWEEIKAFTNSRVVLKIKNIFDSLSLEYDISSLEYPYSFRVIFALVVDMIIRFENKNTNFILNTSNNELWKINQKINTLLLNSSLNSACIFNLIISENVNQSIKTTAGKNYENRVKEKFLSFQDIEIINQSWDSKISSVEYDFIVKYKLQNIGVSVKRTLKERYKQNLENVKDLDVDAMLVVTLGIDLTESIVNNILQKEGYYILVAQEIYNSKDFLKENKKVFSSFDFSFSMFIF